MSVSVLIEIVPGDWCYITYCNAFSVELEILSRSCISVADHIDITLKSVVGVVILVKLQQYILLLVVWASVGFSCISHLYIMYVCCDIIFLIAETRVLVC